MVQKKQNNNNNNFLTNFKLFNKFNTNWDTIIIFCINYFQQNNYSKNIINVVKTIQSNKSFCLMFFMLISWLWSSLILNFIYYFMFVDSLIIALLILQNNCIEINSRRLAKNLILMTLTSLKLIGNMLTLLLVLFIYMEYSKFIGRLIFKFIKFFIKIIGNIFPPIYLLYPNIKLFNSSAPENIYIDEDATIGMGWTGDSYQAASRNSHLKFIYPEDGYAYFIDCLCIPKFASHISNAYKFINFVLQPKIAAQIAAGIGYSTPNDAAWQYMPKSMRDSPIINPNSKVLKRGELERDLGGKIDALYLHYWELLKIEGA